MKILILEFTNDEEILLKKILEWISTNLAINPSIVGNIESDFYINPYTRTYTNNTGLSIHLTAKEFDLLYFLYSHKGQVFSKEQLYENVWGYDDMPASSNLTSFIRKLRKKVEPDPNNPQYIITVWGVGYKFSEEKP